MTETDEQFQQAMNQGHSAAWDQMWDRAAAFYQQALIYFPNHPKALTSLALALYELQKYPESLQAYEQAACVSPEDPVPFEKIAQLNERMGNISRAQSSALQAAELYIKNHELNKAIENWLRITILNPDNLQVHTRLALVYERTGQLKQAADEYLIMAGLFQGARQPEKAMQAVQRALQVYPACEAAHQALNLLYAGKQIPRLVHPAAASAPLRIAQVRQMEASGDGASPSQGLDPVAEAQQKALTFLAGLLFEGPDDEHPRRGSQPTALKAMSLQSAGGSRQADRGRILLHLGQLIDLQTSHQYAEAAEEMRQAVAAGLQEPAAYFDLGYLESQNEQWEAAQRALQQAVKSPNFTLSSHLLMGMALYEMGQLKQASIQCLEALQLADASVVPADQSEDLLQLYGAVIEAYSQIPEAETDRQVVENIAGMLMSKEWCQNLRRARQQLPAQPAGSPAAPLAEIYIQSRSNQVVESLAIINQLARAGNLEAAMDEAYYALLFAPTYLPLHSYMGDLLLKQDRLPEAVAKLLIVARTYSVRGESARAIHLYRRVIDLAPMELAARTCLIDQLLGLGRTEEVAAEYLEFAHVYYDMADLDMARQVLTDALRFAQQSRLDLDWRVKILHNMADIDLQSMDWRQAIKVFEQIRTLKPGDEKACAKLVELNFRLGQEAQAQAELDNTINYLIKTSQRAKAGQFLEDLLSEGLDHPVIHQRLAQLRSNP